MNKNLLYSTENYTQYLVKAGNERESEKEFIYIYTKNKKNINIYIAESLCYTPKINITLETTVFQ